MYCEIKAHVYTCDNDISISLTYGNELYSPYTKSQKCKITFRICNYSSALFSWN